MKSRLRGGLCRVLSALRRLLFHKPGPPAAAQLRGKLRRAVVVPSPDERFSEVVFLLRDDLLRDAPMDRETLLREAARAAERYTAAELPPTPRPTLRPTSAFFIGSMMTILILWLAGLL